MSRTLEISHRAETDLVAIWRWTYEQFGEAQADCYLDKLDQGMKACGSEPESGRDRSALRHGYWSHLIVKHVVFYTFTDASVVIQRVLHASMDFDVHL